MLYCLRAELGDRKDRGIEITICFSPSLIKGSLTNRITLHLFHIATTTGTALHASFHRGTTGVLGGRCCCPYFTEEKLRP